MERDLETEVLLIYTNGRSGRMHCNDAAASFVLDVEPTGPIRHHLTKHRCPAQDSTVEQLWGHVSWAVFDSGPLSAPCSPPGTPLFPSWPVQARPGVHGTSTQNEEEHTCSRHPRVWFGHEPVQVGGDACTGSVSNVAGLSAVVFEGSKALRAAGPATPRSVHL